jgi:hypothetical protein
MTDVINFNGDVPIVGAQRPRHPGAFLLGWREATDELWRVRLPHPSEVVTLSKDEQDALVARCDERLQTSGVVLVHHAMLPNGILMPAFWRYPIWHVARDPNPPPGRRSDV